MRKTSRTLIVIVLALLSLGVVMLASTSSVRGSASFNDPHYFLKRQVVWLILSAVAGTLVARFDYHWWQRLALPLTCVALLLLALVLVPGVGQIINGSRRWLRLGPLSFQPSELAKLAVLVALARWMSQMGRRAGKLLEGLVLPLVGLGAVLALLFLEPDFGTTMLVGVVGMLIMFAGGTRFMYLLITSVAGGSCFMIAVMRDEERARRIMAFLMPDKYPAEAYHLAQSKIAFILGGWFGSGLGNSMQKQFYLPEAHTDFILAIIGEELGFLATLSVVILFAGLLICGILISFKAPDPFGKLLAFGITMLLSLQASLNVGVVTGCLPTKGLPLPFISYGGSSLLMSVVCIAILLNIAGHYGAEGADDHTRSIKDRTYRL